MLDCTPNNLYDEVKAAITLREKHTKMSDDIYDQFVGEAYQEGRHPAIPSHENHAFEFYVNTQPFLVYSNPSWKVNSSRPVVDRQLCKALNHGMNRWTQDVDFAGKLGEVAQDCLFDFGVMLITLDPLPGFEDKETPPLRPAINRISPRKFFQDPQATSARNPRFMGHEFIRDLDDMKNATEPDPSNPKKRRKVYNKEVLDKLGTDQFDSIAQSHFEPGRLPAGVERVPRHQVRGYEIYVPEKKMVYTLGYYLTDGGKRESTFLREPRPYFGPPWGPYIVFGLYGVPDQVYPLSPLAVTVGLVNEINAHTDQIMDQADKARQFTIVNAANDQATDEIKNAANGDILALKGFSKDMVETILVGGPSKEQMDYVDRLRERLDRKSGLTDFQRGNVTGQATATENNLAASAGDVRRKFMQQEFRRGVKRVGQTACWYMTESKSVVFHVPVPNAYFSNDLTKAGDLPGGQGATGGGGSSGASQEEPQPGTNDAEMTDGIFLGGRQPGEEKFNFFNLELDIEPMSMEYMDEGLQRQQVMQVFQLVIQVAPTIPQLPYLNWRALFNDLFESMNIKDGNKYIDFDKVEMMVQQQFQSGQPMGDPGTDGQQAPDPHSLSAGGKPQPGVGPRQLPDNMTSRIHSAKSGATPRTKMGASLLSAAARG